MELSEKLKKYRNMKNYSQSFVADELHVSRQAISNWENGRSCPDIGNLKSLSELYSVSLDELFNDTDMTDEELKDVLTVKKDNEITKEPDREKSRIATDTFYLALLVLVSCTIPPIGVLVSIAVIIKSRQKGINSWVLYALCVVCIIVNSYSTFGIFNNIFMFWGHGTVTKVA